MTTTVFLEADGQRCTIERDEEGMAAYDFIECLVVPAMVGLGYSRKAILDAISELADIPEQK